VASYTFFVHGIPAPKGSTRAFVVKGKAITTDASKRTRPWMFAVADAAWQAIGESIIPAGSPVTVGTHFIVQRPKGHFNAKGELRTKAPARPTARTGDIDKLARCILDALTGIAYVDDAQVVRLFAEKKYINQDSPCPGVAILVEEWRIIE
jgi:crossover junction endodeoxyribonuclease RusA